MKGGGHVASKGLSNGCSSSLIDDDFLDSLLSDSPGGAKRHKEGPNSRKTDDDALESLLGESDRALDRKANIQQPLLSPSLEVGAQHISEQDGLYRDPKNLTKKMIMTTSKKEGQPVIQYDSSPVGATLNDTTHQFEIDSLPIFSPPSMNIKHSPEWHTTHLTGHQRSLHQGRLKMESFKWPTVRPWNC
jgi:hypothetical protein